MAHQPGYNALLSMIHDICLLAGLYSIVQGRSYSENLATVTIMQRRHMQYYAWFNVFVTLFLSPFSTGVKRSRG